MQKVFVEPWELIDQFSVLVDALNSVKHHSEQDASRTEYKIKAVEAGVKRLRKIVESHSGDAHKAYDEAIAHIGSDAHFFNVSAPDKMGFLGWLEGTKLVITRIRDAQGVVASHGTA